MRFLKKRKVAVALGGGAARGIANIGVLKVLEREGIPIDLVAGTSMGALVGAGYALGIPIYRMEKAALKFSLNKLVDFSLSKRSVLSGKKLEAHIKDFVDNKTFKDTIVPLAITTTDIETGEELVHTKGELKKLVLASCSWPGIFPPVVVNNRKLTDGGIRNSIPVKAAKKLGATLVIAVHVGFSVKKGKMDNLFQIFVQSIQILGEELDNYQATQADVVISPALGDIDQFGFDHAKDALRDGEEAAEKAIPEIRKKLGINLWK